MMPYASHGQVRSRRSTPTSSSQVIVPAMSIASEYPRASWL